MRMLHNKCDVYLFLNKSKILEVQITHWSNSIIRMDHSLIFITAMDIYDIHYIFKIDCKYEYQLHLAGFYVLLLLLLSSLSLLSSSSLSSLSIIALLLLHYYCTYGLGEDHTYMTIVLINNGQSRVNVSYSPPSPHIFNPYFSFCKGIFLCQGKTPSGFLPAKPSIHIRPIRNKSDTKTREILVSN